MASVVSQVLHVALRASPYLYTLPDESGGGVYLYPVATDGFPFKILVHQHGPEVVAGAIANPSLARNCKAGGCETFEDYLPMALSDSVNAELHWKSGQLKDVVGRIVRLEVCLRHAKLFAIRGTLHFIDAQDKWMIEDGKPIAT